MKKLIALWLVTVMVLTFCACGKQNETTSNTQNEEASEKIKVAACLQSGTISYWVNAQHTWERLAEENNFSLTVYDCKDDATATQDVVDSIILAQPDVAVFFGADVETAVSQSKDIQAAGIPVIMYNMSPDLGQECPSVVMDQSNMGFIAGEAAGKWWKENRDGDQAYIMTVDFFAAGESCALRSYGFVDGFQSIVPEAIHVISVDGNATRSDSLAAVEDGLVAHPECNVFYGINGDSGLGAFDALTSAGITSRKEAIVCACDGSVQECAEIVKGDDETTYLYTVGNSPKMMVEAAWNLAQSMLNGEVDSWSYYAVQQPLSLIDASNAQTFGVTEFE